MTEHEERYLHSLLRLISVQGMGSFRIRRLISYFKTASEVLSADLLSLTGIDGIDKILAKNIRAGGKPDFAGRQLQACRKHNIQIITYYDERYPSALKETPDPPILLFMKGAFQDRDVISIGVVGTRIPSQYGKRVAELLSKDLIQNGFTIVSGLARGIDTIAHQTCVKLGARTIAVMGSGLDIIYPTENKKLSDLIIENGALLSELPCGSLPDAVNFPKRNRIISGLSLGVLIVEAGEKSGALITATSALNQNREVFAIPGSIFSTKSSGTNRLIKEGAKLVQSVDDILEELQHRVRSFSFEKSDFKALPIDLSDKEKKLMSIFSDDPIHIDMIAQKTGFSTAETLSVLLTLELKDVIKQFSGKMFVRI